MTHRFALLTVLCCAIPTFAAKPATRPGARPAPRGSQPKCGPVSQNRIDWTMATMCDVYRKYGDHTKKWNENAAGAILAAARLWGEFPRQTYDEWELMDERSGAAVRGGCKDPLVLYIRARILRNAPKRRAAIDADAVEAFKKGNYPAFRQFFAMIRLASDNVEISPDDDNVKKASREGMEEAFKLFPQICADKKMPPQALCNLMASICEASERIMGNSDEQLNRAAHELEKAGWPKPVILTGKAAAYFSRAARARGTDYANKVSEAQWREVNEQLAKARNAAEEAWRLDDKSAETAIAMLQIELLDSHGRPEYEKWFHRAIDLDPDDSRPYRIKLNRLRPQWYGSTQDMVAFGRECAKEGRWSCLAPMTLIDARWNAAYYGEGRTTKGLPDPKYFESSPEIYDEMKPIYERYCAEIEPSDYQRTRWAAIAAYSGEWIEANDIFKSLGKGKSHSVLHNDKELNELVRQAQEKGKK